MQYLLANPLVVKIIMLTTPLLVLIIFASLPFLIVRIRAHKYWVVLLKKKAELEAVKNGEWIGNNADLKKYALAKWKRENEANEWYANLCLAFAAAPSVNMVYALLDEKQVGFELTVILFTMATVFMFSALLLFSVIAKENFKNEMLIGYLTKRLTKENRLSVGEIAKVNDTLMAKLEIHTIKGSSQLKSGNY